MMIIIADEMITLRSKKNPIDCNCLPNCDDSNFFIQAYVRICRVSVLRDRSITCCSCCSRCSDRVSGFLAPIFSGVWRIIPKCSWTGTLYSGCRMYSVRCCNNFTIHFNLFFDSIHFQCTLVDWEGSFSGAVWSHLQSSCSFSPGDYLNNLHVLLVNVVRPELYIIHLNNRSNQSTISIEKVRWPMQDSKKVSSS